MYILRYRFDYHAKFAQWCALSGFGGVTKTSGQGRKKGVPNKVTTDLRNMIIGALSDVGGREYLARQATESPGAFLTLVGKILPTQLQGDPENPIEVRITQEKRRLQAIEAIDLAFPEYRRLET